jgi:hypothetical protein
MVALRVALAVALAGCYAPKITECTITCGAGGACPQDLQCLADGYCHADDTPHCLNGDPADASVGADARRDASMGMSDARQADARGPVDAGPDARRSDAGPGVPDAATPDAGQPGCTDQIRFVEEVVAEDAVLANLSLGPDGHAHITYVDETADVLRYAHRPAGAASWSFETVGPAADHLKGQALDGAGGLHVVYSERLPAPSIAYAYRAPRAGATWDGEVIDDSALAIDGTIAVDGDGAVHVAYWYNLSDLAYAVRFSPDGLWFGDLVATDGVVGEHPSLAIDGDGVLHLSFRVAGTRNDLGYAILDPLLPIWQPVALDGENNVGAYTALAVDPSDNVHVVYADLQNENLRYAFLPPVGSRRFGPADTKRFSGRFNGIATDAEGGVHVSTFDYGERDLRYGYKARNAADFTFRTIDSAGDVGRHAGIAVDADGAAHIAYIDDGRGDLKYAILCAP